MRTENEVRRKMEVVKFTLERIHKDLPEATTSNKQVNHLANYMVGMMAKACAEAVLEELKWILEEENEAI
jgi:hypothetical protein